MSPDVVLTVRYMPATATCGAGQVGRFVRYVERRDVHPDSREAGDVDDLVAYVHHRDPTSRRGRMFDADGPAGDPQRQALVDTVARSLEELRLHDRTSTTTERAAYRMIISPADARGLDLQRLTRAAMARLRSDLGGQLPPWVAGEHRNTQHPHVHVVMAARREIGPGRFRTVLITRERLAHMKAAVEQELALQREARLRLTRTALRAGEAESKSRLQTGPVPSTPPATSVAEPRRSRVEHMVAWSDRARRLPRPTGHYGPTLQLAAMAGRLARYNRAQAEREARRRRHGVEDDTDLRDRSRHL